MIFFKNTPMSDNEILFEAMDGESCLGKCLLRISDYAEIISLYDYNDFFMALGLCLAALNYAALRNIYMSKFTDTSAFDVAKALNFQLIKGVYESDIPSILTGSCCNCK